MNAIPFKNEWPAQVGFCDSVFKIINAKIQKTDSELTRFLATLQKTNQKPGRPNEQGSEWLEKQKQVFDIIESASICKTKLFFLRANLSDHNSVKVLHLISTSSFKELSLQELKKGIQ